MIMTMRMVLIMIPSFVAGNVSAVSKEGSAMRVLKRLFYKRCKNMLKHIENWSQKSHFACFGNASLHLLANQWKRFQKWLQKHAILFCSSMQSISLQVTSKKEDQKYCRFLYASAKLLASTPKDLQKHANPLWTQLLVLFNNTKNITKIFRSSSLFRQPYSENTVVCYLMLMLSLFEFIFGSVSPHIQNNTIAMATKSAEHHSYYKNEFPRQYW